MKSTHSLTPWCRVLLEKLTVLQLVKKFPAFLWNPKVHYPLTSVRHLSLSWASPIQSTYPHPTSWRSIPILYTHLCLGLPSGLFPSSFPTETLYAPLSSPIYATCPAHPILLDFITRTILGEEYSSFSSLLCNLLHSPVTSSLLGGEEYSKAYLLTPRNMPATPGTNLGNTKKKGEEYISNETYTSQGAVEEHFRLFLLWGWWLYINITIYSSQ